MNKTTWAEALTEAVERRDQAERDVYAAVDEMRAEGASWTVIGTLLGITRQSAWQRYGDAGGASGPTD